MAGKGVRSTRMELPRNVSIISTRMVYKDQVKITTKAVEILNRCRKHENMEMFTSKLKAYLDDKYGLIWHVVCTTGSYWMNFAHDGPWTLNFNVDEFQILTWKTPFNESMSHSKLH
ncbi:Tegument antigen [Echinococcus granulosus]|uniref:Tegument antigen n=1 Tax=Echinococcus granulosus TaxID=6210 RepID=U6JGV2_ECHGR|nr:Tegument antigen [Echinococcus granulosus]EUB55444.1 Tegument antigen [Echinococcus granulosus]KAH9285095.1 Tegument antigen [Echinococcus granulosus]CDS23282.1 tegumental antigene [Echinococcus granulosus]